MVKEFYIGKDKSHKSVTRIQFPIQLAVARPIHRSQGLSLDEMAFDPTNVTKHGLTYIALSRIRTKEKLYLLTPLEHKKFHVDECVSQEMSRLRSLAKWNLLVPRLKLWQHSHVIIQSLNVNLIQKHHKDIDADFNIQSLYILCLQETHVQSSCKVQKFINTTKYKYIYVFGGHGSILMYDNHMVLESHYIRDLNIL